MAFPEKFHRMINEDVGPGAPKKMSDCKAMQHSRGHVEIPARAITRRDVGRLGPPFHIKLVKSPETIEASLFKERKEVLSLVQQPITMGA
jgi:hypothetical protein